MSDQTTDSPRKRRPAASGAREGLLRRVTAAADPATARWLRRLLSSGECAAGGAEACAPRAAAKG
jgi:hypothetical protein